MAKFTGECVKCGYCCQYMAMPMPNTPAVAEWFAARGWSKVFTEGEVSMYTIRHPCPNLKGDNTCRIHDRKPALCKVYPHNLGDARLLGKCKGYKVES